MNVIIAQIIAFFALTFTIISVHQKEKKNILTFQTLSSFSYLAQYVCLYAWAGAAMTNLSIIRNFLFYYYDEKKKKKSIFALLLILVLIAVATIFTYDGILSLFPSAIALIYTIALWQNNMRIFRYVSVISPVCWFVYDISVSALISTIACIVEFIGAVTAVLRFDIDKKD